MTNEEDRHKHEEEILDEYHDGEWETFEVEGGVLGTVDVPVPVGAYEKAFELAEEDEAP